MTVTGFVDAIYPPKKGGRSSQGQFGPHRGALIVRRASRTILTILDYPIWMPQLVDLVLAVGTPHFSQNSVIAMVLNFYENSFRRVVQRPEKGITKLIWSPSQDILGRPSGWAASHPGCSLVFSEAFLKEDRRGKPNTARKVAGGIVSVRHSCKVPRALGPWGGQTWGRASSPLLTPIASRLR